MERNSKEYLNFINDLAAEDYYQYGTKTPVDSFRSLMKDAGLNDWVRAWHDYLTVYRLCSQGRDPNNRYWRVSEDFLKESRFEFYKDENGKTKVKAPKNLIKSTKTIDKTSGIQSEEEWVNVDLTSKMGGYAKDAFNVVKAKGRLKDIINKDDTSSADVELDHLDRVILTPDGSDKREIIGTLEEERDPNIITLEKEAPFILEENFEGYRIEDLNISKDRNDRYLVEFYLIDPQDTACNMFVEFVIDRADVVRLEATMDNGERLQPTEDDWWRKGTVECSLLTVADLLAEYC